MNDDETVRFSGGVPGAQQPPTQIASGPGQSYPAQSYPEQSYPAYDEPATMRTTAPEPRGEGVTLFLAAALLILVSVGIGVYGRTHQAAFFAFNVAGFSSGTSAKVWIASLAFLFGLVQLWSALVMYGKLGSRAPSWIGGLHRWSGRIAVIVSVPVAVHCLYALGFQTGEPRVLVHSIAGCLFYGAFVAKMLTVSRKTSPSWLLPVLGGLVFTGLTVLWLTAAGWFFTTSGITF